MTGSGIALPTRRATIRLARRIAAVLAPGDLVVLSGQLGAGKTFLVRAVCRALGVPGDVRVTSPTFTLVNEYDTVPKVIHADLYRLGSEEEALDLGLLERREQGCAVLVEWGEPYVAALGGDALVVSLSVDPRQARLAATGPRSQELLASLRATG